jgi:sugar phosphate isomerase/epimerase
MAMPYPARVLGMLILCLPLGLLLGGQAVGEVRDDSAAEKLGWHLATKAYVFMHQQDFITTLDITRDLGLRYIEMNPRQTFKKGEPGTTDASASPELRQRIRQALADHHITAIGLGVMQMGSDPDADRATFTFARDIGIPLIIAEPKMSGIDSVADLASEFHIRVAIHNHPLPALYATPAKVLAAIAGHEQWIGDCADIGHWARSGLAPIDCMHQLAGHIFSFHFKDTNRIGRGAVDVPLGTGADGIPDLLKEAHRQGFTGLFALEYEPPHGSPLLADLRASIATFDRIAASIAAGTGPAAP